MLFRMLLEVWFSMVKITLHLHNDCTGRICIVLYVPLRAWFDYMTSLNRLKQPVEIMCLKQ